MPLEFSVLKHQRVFLEDIKTRYLALVGGFGSGKTRSFVMKSIYLASLNKGYRGACLEPTHSMVVDTLIPAFDDVLDEYKIPHKFKATPYPQYNLKFKGGDTQLLLRSGENYRRLAGLNLAFFGVDEVDTIEKNIAVAMWRLLQSRLRAGNVYQGFATSTPEGFNFLYEYFEKDGKNRADRRLIRAKTRDNPFLPPEYIQDLLANYPPELIQAYLEGEFVNLNSGRVYHNFDRVLNQTDLTIDDFPRHPLHIGQDFNIGKCASVVHVIEDNVPIAIDELSELKNTEAVIDEINRRYPNRAIVMYPDSSGKNEKTNASYSDIQLLRAAGYDVRHPSKNPFVRDRIGSMNAMFLNGLGQRRYKVNTTKCPKYTQALEQQAYNKNGDPDKMHNEDHPVDAAGYFIHFTYPLSKARTFQHSMY